MSWTEASRTGTAETDGDEDRRTGNSEQGEQRGNLDRGQDNRETETTRGRDSRTGRGQGAPDGKTDTGDGESWPEDGRTPPENPRRPLGRWQTQGNAPNPCAGSTQGPLANAHWHSRRPNDHENCLLHSLPWAWNRAYSASSAAAHGCWPVGVLSGIAEHTPACKRFIPRRARVPSVRQSNVAHVQYLRSSHLTHK